MICFSGEYAKVGRKVGVKAATFLTGLPLRKPTLRHIFAVIEFEQVSH